MESATPYSPPTFSREVRLGMFAYSGIASSLYMSGVCQEFYQAVRGRGVYKLLKALVDADVVLDTLSGTSAGGVNVLLLSYALTNSTATEVVDFNAFQEIWQNSGDIYQLLCQPPASLGVVMDGDGYQQQQLEAALVNAFQQRVPPPEGEWVSQFRELDLLVTGTDFWGKNYRYLDDSGSIAEMQEHCGLFHLKHRQGRKEPFNPLSPDVVDAKPQHTFQALAKLGRLTTALPVLFPTVQVDLNNAQNLVDRQLGIWGQLDQRHWQHRPEGKQISFLDGGLLGNTPFRPALRMMYQRPAVRWTQRVLFYVDPTPLAIAPVKKSIAALALPMSQSVVNDLRYIQEHNQKVRRYRELMSQAEASLTAPVHVAQLHLQKSIYTRSRLINLRTQVLPDLLRLAAGSDSNRQPELERITQLLTAHQVNPAEKEQRETCLRDFAPQLTQLDVDYSLRQHCYLTHKIQEELLITKSATERFDLEVLLKRIGQSIQLIEVIKAALQELFSNLVISDNFYAMLEVKKSNHFLRPLVYEYIFRLHRYLLDVQALPLLMPVVDGLSGSMDEMVELSELFINLPLTANETRAGWLPTAQISTVWQQLQRKIEILANAANHGQYLWNKQRFHYDRRENQHFLSMLTQIESATTMLLHNSPTTAARSLLHYFQNFEHLDRLLYPWEYLTDLGEKELLSTVRISPGTAQLGRGQGKSAIDKLAGDNFYETGGLFQNSWRVNDRLWGRLDGLSRLLEGLVNPGTVQYFSGFVQREARRLSLTTVAYIDFLLTESLPHLVGQERQLLRSHLTYLAQPDLEISPEKLRELLNDVVMAGHQQILAGDVPPLPSTPSSPPTRGLVTSQALTQDPWQSSVVKMAQEITQESLDNLTLSQAQFFRQQYKVGSAQLFENVPGMVVVNGASWLVLGLRDLLTTWRQPAVRQQVRPYYLQRGVNRYVGGVLNNWYWWLQSRGTQLVLQLSAQPWRLAWRGSLAAGMMLLVILTTFNPLIWLVVGVVSLVSWGTIDLTLRHQRRRPRQPQRLLTVKSLFDR
jgi:patatin-related protein